MSPSPPSESQHNDADKTPAASETPARSIDPNSTLSGRPFYVLGIDSDSDAATVRARYLELVRMHPPDRDPVMFARIRYAYESASDPIVMAKRMIDLTTAEPRPWLDIIDEHASRPPRLPAEVLLSLGNRKKTAKADAEPVSETTRETES